MGYRKKPEGSGRRKGSLNRKTQAIAKDMIASGAMTPLEVMVKAMKVHVDAQRWDAAAAIAKDAAPYIHPRLAAIQHSGGGDGSAPIVVITGVPRQQEASVGPSSAIDVEFSREGNPQ